MQNFADGQNIIVLSVNSRAAIPESFVVRVLMEPPYCYPDIVFVENAFIEFCACFI